MTRRYERPPCFFNDLDDQNKQLIGLTANVRDRTDDIIRKSAMIDDNLYNRATEGSKKIDLILRSDDLNNFNKHMLDTTNKMTDNKNKTSEILSKLNTKNVTVDESSTLNKIQLAVSKLVSNGIDRIISSSSDNMATLISQKFKPEHANQIISKLTILIYDKINNNIFGDVNDMVNNLVENKKLDKVISMSIENIMREDKTYATYMSGGNNNIKIGDFVYFKHKVSTNNKDLWIDEPAQREIIVGGKVCNIDELTNKVKINYLYSTNPNFNKRASADPRFSYDRGVSGLPKWYIATGNDLSMKCGPSPVKDGACKPSQWPADKDAWVRQYVGGFDRSKDEMSCGVGPSASNDYPNEVNIMNLSKSLEEVVNSCQSKMSYNPISATPLPKPKYNPSEQIMLPMPKLEDLPPPPPRKTNEQIEREKMQEEAQRKIEEEEQAELRAMKGSTSMTGPLDLQKRQINKIALENDTTGRQSNMRTDQNSSKAQAPQSFKINQSVFNQPKPRDENSAENRCINANTDDSKEDRYITNANGLRFRIVNGKIMLGTKNSTLQEADRVLSLPRNVKPSYLFRKQGSDTILAYADEKWFQYVSVTKMGANGRPALDDSGNIITSTQFEEISQTDLNEKYDGEINPTGSCVKGSKV